jgi:hypothetical protein
LEGGSHVSALASHAAVVVGGSFSHRRVGLRQLGVTQRSKVGTTAVLRMHVLLADGSPHRQNKQKKKKLSSRSVRTQKQLACDKIACGGIQAA